MEIDLAKHVVPSLQIFLNRVESFVRNIDSLFSIDFQGVKDPFEIKISIFRAGHQAVAQQIIHAIAIKLTGYQLSDIGRLIFMPNNLDYVFRQIRIKQSQALIHFGIFISNDSLRPKFMMYTKDLFNDMRKRTVTDIVQQRS